MYTEKWKILPQPKFDEQHCFFDSPLSVEASVLSELPAHFIHAFYMYIQALAIMEGGIYREQVFISDQNRRLMLTTQYSREEVEDGAIENQCLLFWDDEHLDVQWRPFIYDSSRR